MALIGADVDQSYISNNILDSLSFPWHTSDRRLWSLWEMIEHVCSHFCAVYQRLADEIRWLDESKKPHAVLSEREKTRIYTTTMSLVEDEICKLKFLEIGAETEVFGVQSLNGRLESGDKFTREVLKTELKHVQKDLILRLMKLKFAYIPAPNDKFFEQDRLFGDEVYNVFEEARQDIKESGNCLSAELYTACVFHLMRVSEYGLRAIAVEVGVTITHTGNMIPLEYGEWDQIITQINLKIAVARQLPRDATREKQLQVYSEASQHCLFMKDIWRNTVAHARKSYIEKEAVATMERVRDFMQFLAKGMK